MSPLSRVLSFEFHRVAIWAAGAAMASPLFQLSFVVVATAERLWRVSAPAEADEGENEHQPQRSCLSS